MTTTCDRVMMCPNNKSAKHLSVPPPRLSINKGAGITDTGLEGRTVLVTGASRNIGRRTAVMFAQEGANLAICTRRSMERLDQTATEVERTGASVITGRCDVADASAVASFVKRTCEEFGAIDVERDAYQKKKDFYKHQLIRRRGTSDEVASLVVYLASEMAGYITGQCYLVNGGAYLQ